MGPLPDSTLCRVVALTALPEFIDHTGRITGTIDGTYNPTFVGERGFMTYLNCAPLDIGVPTTGDQVGICWYQRPQDIDAAILAATPFAVGAQAQAREEEAREAAGGSPED